MLIFSLVNREESSKIPAVLHSGDDRNRAITLRNAINNWNFHKLKLMSMGFINPDIIEPSIDDHGACALSKPYIDLTTTH